MIGKRNRKFMKNLLTIITLFVFTNSFGQNVWTLKECIDYAYEHNLSLKEYELNAKIDQNRLYQSKMDVLPNLNAGVSQNYNYGRTVDPFTNDFVTDRVRSDNYYVNSSVTLFQGFQKLHTIKRNEYNLQSSLVMIDAIKNDMAINITSAYLQVLFEMELVKQAEDQLDLTKDQYLLTKEKVDAGSLAKGQLYEMESMVSMDEYNLIAAKNRLEIALLNLRQMLDIDNETGFEIRSPTRFSIPRTIYLYC
jgi:outer membrane protein